ncbi:methyltransferase [Brevibacillus ruminantium]|uniref:Methyltransferase n=1 Tax=Brevibacillus ruminantium TaxID=2950604 RepID=A0ABY4WFE5_9BACL|nr:methyltransferase [Brevibacillus ruminantium]USG64525.1 methyltransferase [Brevibacillus ruminantium]
MRSRFLGFCFAFLSLFFLSACSEKSEDTQSILYENPTHHFTLQLPKSWEGKYEVKETENQIFFSSKANQPGGILCEMRIWSKEEWKQDGEELTAIIHLEKIGETDDKVYSFSTPTDVQWVVGDAEKEREYQAMFADVPSIKASFAIQE